jgi:hypothetical protein
MFSDGEVVAAFLALAACAALASAITPKPRGWNNSRAATQRDVADVLAGKGRNRRDPRADPLYSLLLVFAFLALVWAILS